MTHIVIHDDRDGVTHYHQFDDVRDAAGFLEMLYDSDDVDRARLYALHEVDFAVRSYVKVEIGGTEVTKPIEPPAAAAPRREAPTAAAAPRREAPAAVAPRREAPTAAAEPPAPDADESEVVPIDPEVVPMDDVEYVEASMAPPEPVETEPVEVAGSAEPRRGLFGR